MITLYSKPAPAWVYGLILFFSVNIVSAQITDLCSPTSQIIPLDGACRPYGITASGATPFTNSTDTPALTCPGTPTRDGWFRIVTNANTAQISIEGSGNTSSVRFTGLALYSGSCGSYTEVACNIPGQPNASLLNVNVSPSTTYYLRVMRTDSDPSTANLSGTLCAVTTVTSFNDDCAAATGLAVSPTTTCTTSTSGTSTGATASGLATCAGNPDDDVWYRFVATAPAHNITVTPVTMNNVVFQVLGGSCAGLTSIGCANITTGSAAETAVVSGLAVGQPYYVRVYSNNATSGQGTFNICVTVTASGIYCMPVSDYSSDYISNFTTTGGTTNISNSSGFSVGGYGNYTAQTVSAFAGNTINLSASFYDSSFFAYGCNIWVDWNNNGVFSTAEKIYASAGQVYGLNASYTIPTGTAAGNYRMRIRIDDFSNDPDACAIIDYGEAEDYTLNVASLLCTTVPSGINVTPIATTTATVNWNPPASPPGSGYNYYYSTSATPPSFASTGSGTTAAGVTSANIAGLTASTNYYVWVRSNCGSGNLGLWVGPSTFTTAMNANGAAICIGGSANVTATGTCIGIGSVSSISGSWNAATNPIALQPEILIDNSTVCDFDTVTANYTTFNFTVNVSGNYTFAMAANPNYDGMGYIVVNGFTPGVCGSGTWIVGDDDSGGTSLEPVMTAALSTGVTYTLISTVFGFSNTTVTDSFVWSITSGSGGFVQAAAPGTIQWYTAASGGSPIGTGSSFNPVGVTGSGLPDTNTAGSTTYYAACSGNASVRTPVNYVINSGPTSTISATGGICTANAGLNIVLTGTAPWNLTYVNNIGDPPVNVTGIMSSPLIIPVTPNITSTYTVTALSDAGCLTGVSFGSAVFEAVVWTGVGTSWSSPLNWSTGAVPTSSDCVVIPAAPNYATITATDDGEAQYLTIRNGGRLDVTNSRTLTVTNRVDVDFGGILNIESGASLLQIDNVTNLGDINLRRTISVKLYDYTYWNAPVAFDLLDTTPFTLEMLGSGAPEDKYYSWIPSTGSGTGNGNWLQEDPATPMNPQKGYIIRAPLGTSPDVSFLHTMTFTGVPNNGNLTAPIFAGAVTGDNDLWNLIGNPYPSAISVASFLQNANNNPLLDSTVYLWTHNSDPSTIYDDPFYGDFYSNYSDSDYASCTALGCVQACATCEEPNGNIGAGQSFFIKSSGLSGNVEFNNSMRTPINTQFFRIADPSANQSQMFTDTSEKQGIWLNMTNEANNAFNQILVAYAETATVDYDDNLDGERWSVSNMIFYSVIPEKKLVIQARPLPFDVNDLVPLGYKVDIAGNYSIGIDKFDPLFNDYFIYIEDLTLNVIHDLKVSPYSFSSAAGTFNERFMMRYTSQALSVNDFNSNGITAFITNNFLHVRASEMIESVQVFDIGGKLIRTCIPQTDELTNSWDFNYAQGAYLAKIKLQSGTVETRKLMN